MELPYRHLARLQSETHLLGLDALYRVAPGRFSRGLIFLSIARVCVGDWICEDGFAPPSHPSASTSVRAMASSLHRPFETVRRNILALIDDGICELDGSALRLNPAGPAAARTARYYADIHDAFLSLTNRVYEFGVPLPTPQPGAAHPLATVIYEALDFNLEPLDTFRVAGWNWNMMLLWVAISTLMIRHITYDPELSHRYAVDYTPDDQRRPVSLHAAAKLIQMPYATAWRDAEKLKALGLMRHCGNGWVINSDQLRDERVKDTMIVHSNHLVRRIRTAILDGFDPETICDHYLTNEDNLLRSC